MPIHFEWAERQGGYKMSDPITNIFKMLFSGGLTRTGVDYGGAAPPSDQPGMISEHDGGSNQRFFHDPRRGRRCISAGDAPCRASPNL